MNAITFRSLPKLLAHADDALRTADAVTLDVFDTLLVRRPHDPGLVKRPVAAYVADRARAAGVKITWEDVWRTRDRYEAAHRDRNRDPSGDQEAAYPEFMRAALEEIFGRAYTPALLDDVTEYELAAEAAAITARPALAAWVARTAAAGKRVYLLSDMYLPGEVIRRLVEAKGVAGVAGVVSSADTLRTKASGRAFALVRERYGLRPEAWIHIGDNPVSDGVRPAQFGVRAFVLRDRGEAARKARTGAEHARAARTPAAGGRYVQALMQPLDGDPDLGEPLFAEGYEFFGFLLGYFTLRLLERCRAENVSHVYFCAREGWVLWEYWKRAAPILCPAGPLPGSSYLHVSRLAVARAAAGNGLTPLSAATALLPDRNRDATDVCRVFGLDTVPLLPLLARAGLAAESSIDTPADRQKLDAALADPDFQAEVRRQAGGRLGLFERYLEQEGFFRHRTVALVDLGWLGTIQHYLSEAVRHRPDAPALRGMLLGATRFMPYQDDDRSRVEGLVYDRRRLDYSDSLLAGVKDVLEEVLRAPHPSVIGYVADGGGVRPVLRPANDAVGLAETLQDARYENLRRGILAAAPRFAAAVALTGHAAGDLTARLRSQLVRKLAFPTVREVELLRPRVHQDDFSRPDGRAGRIATSGDSLWTLPTAALRLPLVRRYYYWRHAARIRRGML